MCGIVGFGSIRGGVYPRDQIQPMADQLRHRGPDGEGIWVSPSGQLALGHRRLSIIDLSACGCQPMISPSARYTITFNGEVYNFGELRKELADTGVVFRGRSDTEVMLAAFDRWGVRPSLDRFIGMFAFGVWDEKLRTLTLVRDRVGVKPLYYGWARGGFCFGSELKGLFPPGSDRPQIDREAVGAYGAWGYVPSPQSIFQGVWKLEPGSSLEISQEEFGAPPTGFSPVADSTARSPKRYWDLRTKISSVRSSEPQSVLVDRAEALLTDSVRLRMIADVPVGAFLSGGIDSSLVVALMQRLHSSPVRTFSIALEEVQYNEARFAARVARHLGTKHLSYQVTAEECQAIIPRLPTIFDEPFGDSSQLPTLVVSRLARRDVTVVLSGDGGDEVFGGYTRYQAADRLWRLAQAVPAAIRGALGAVLERVPLSLEGRLAPVARVLPPWLGTIHLIERLHRARSLLNADSFLGMYGSLMQFFPPRTGAPFPVGAGIELSRYEQMILIDTLSYLPDDILVKVDRATMASGLEAREPLLDHRLIEFAWSLPGIERGELGSPKRILRAVLERYVPREFFNRPKMGFRIPIDRWLRGSLRPWAESLLSESALNRHQFFDVAAVRSAWGAHLSGRRNEQSRLWVILMFQSWYEQHHDS